MYFTVAELDLLLLRRQLQHAQDMLNWAKDRDWSKSSRNWKREIRRLRHRIMQQEARVRADLDKRNKAKVRWLERLA